MLVVEAAGNSCISAKLDESAEAPELTRHTVPKHAVQGVGTVSLFSGGGGVSRRVVFSSFADSAGRGPKKEL